MPRAAKPKKRVEDDFEDDEEGHGLEVVQEEPELDEVERVIASLAGSKQVSATVYRELEGREQVVDRLTMHAGIDLADILQRLAVKHGHGVYRLQLREVGKNGTLRNITLPEIAEGAFGAKPAEAPPPPAPKDDPLRELLLRQNEQLMGMMREAIARPAPPPVPGASLQDQMANLAAMFRFARGLSKAAGEPELPGWMETLGKVAAPALAAIADGIKKPTPAAAPRPVPNVASSAPLPASAPPAASATELVPAEETKEGPEEERTPTDVAIGAVLSAAAREANPDPDHYANIVWTIAAAEFTGIAGMMPQGGLATAVAQQFPALKDKTEFLTKLETALRAKVAAANPEPKE